MKRILLRCLVFGIVLVMIISKPKQMSKFEKMTRECSNTPECKSRPNDENCVYKCTSELCYREIYGDYLLEYGEVNVDLRTKFEKCFAALNK